MILCFFFFSSRRRHTRCLSDWSSDVCSSDLGTPSPVVVTAMGQAGCHPAPGARPQSACELAEIVRRYGPAYRAAHRLPLAHLKVLQAIESCRTAALGGHREHCAQCGFERFAYNSCRNRHCPKCQALAKEQWLQARQAELLPVPYFHNVFTLPHELNALILCHQQNQRAVLNLLFQATAETLLRFGRTNLGGTLGATLVLHIRPCS